MSFPLFSGFFASSRAATVFAPDDIPTFKYLTRYQRLSKQYASFFIQNWFMMQHPGATSPARKQH